ncbi:DUF397 domain-containing protein [Lentzea sp. NPDC059081]|uniref:DUF397 domain-containing protein n=1 Tax=Lentzea sp. NPDC059081 TaxID=3346719 RepID=UPI00368EF8D0
MAAELRWIRSSYSSDSGASCVECASGSGRTTFVRDSKDPSGPLLRFSADAWSVFVASTHLL